MAKLIIAETFFSHPETYLCGYGDTCNSVEATKLVKRIKACDGVVEVYVQPLGMEGVDNLYIKTLDMVSVELALIIGELHPDECGWNDALIRLWWD